MRRFHRLVLLALLIGAAPAIGGCADFDMDKLDILGLNKKKPLPGERHAVFPEGVPGVTQGIPPELMMGSQQAQTGAAIPIDGIKPADANQTAAAKPEEKPKAKPKPKKVAQTSRPTRIKMAPQEQPAAQPAAAPAASAPPAAQPASAQQGWPAPAQSGAPWPDPPQSGTFSKQ